MDDQEQLRTMEAALKHGGNFYHHLAKAFFAADAINKRILFAAFEDHLIPCYGPGSQLFHQEQRTQQIDQMARN